MCVYCTSQVSCEHCQLGGSNLGEAFAGCFAVPLGANWMGGGDIFVEKPKRASILKKSKEQNS